MKTNKFNNKFLKIILCLCIIFILIYMAIIFKNYFPVKDVIIKAIDNNTISSKVLLFDSYYCFQNINTSSMAFLITIFQNNSIMTLILNLIFSGIYILLIIKIFENIFDKKQKYILVIVLLCGISSDYMSSIFLYTSYIYHTINALLLLFLCIKISDSNIIKNILFFLSMFFISINSCYYLFSILIPFVITQLVFRKKDTNINTKKIFQSVFLIMLVLGYLIIIYSNYIFDLSEIFKFSKINNRIISILDIIISFFGIGNGKNLLIINNKVLLYNEFPTYSLISIYSITIFFRVLFLITTIFIIPFVSFKKRKSNSLIINKIYFFNIVSIFISVFIYLLCNNFIYDIYDIKYFFINFILMIVMDIYIITKYFMNNDVSKKIIISLFTLYVVFNIISNIIYILN